MSRDVPSVDSSIQWVCVCIGELSPDPAVWGPFRTSAQAWDSLVSDASLSLDDQPETTAERVAAIIEEYEYDVSPEALQITAGATSYWVIPLMRTNEEGALP